MRGFVRVGFLDSECRLHILPGAVLHKSDLLFFSASRDGDPMRVGWVRACDPGTGAVRQHVHCAAALDHVFKAVALETYFK